LFLQKGDALIENEGRIEITLPVGKEFASLLRLMVSGIASRMNFNLDAVDDLRIAVEEAYLMAMAHRVADRLKVVFLIQADRLRIDLKGQTEPVEEKEKQSDNFGAFILEAVVDEIETDQAQGQFGLKLTKYL
jgi:serine/threonine-protein kinase RsbW